ncbi:MAG: four helix bundle protein [Bacteroidota bacterium]|nr:four helix bundle protein [Bacteroidota bacterium]
MASIHKFEDLDCWKKGRTLCSKIHKCTLNIGFSKDFSLKDQITRASGSVMDNIAEGFERGGNKEFIQFLFIAKASCAEVKSQLYRALDRSYINEKEFQDNYIIAAEVSRLIKGLILYLNNSSKKGFKYDKVDGNRNDESVQKAI